MPTPEPQQLEPVRNDGIRAIQVGLGLWLVAGLVLLVARDELADRGTQWWLGVCVAGFAFGLVQLALFSRRRALGRARERMRVEEIATRDPQSSDRGSSGPTAGPTG